MEKSPESQIPHDKAVGLLQTIADSLRDGSITEKVSKLELTPEGLQTPARKLRPRAKNPRRADSQPEVSKIDNPRPLTSSEQEEFDRRYPN